MKKRIAILLALLLALQFLPLGRSATQALLTPVSASGVNPLYAGLETDELPVTEPAPEPVETPALRADSITSVAALVRAQLKQRSTSFIVSYLSATTLTQSALDQIFATAIAHTGNPTEGDYLRFQFETWRATSSQGMVTNGGYLYNITFTMTYYTIAEQESLVDTQVKNLLYNLKLNGKTDVQKLRAIYDYLCANVTYGGSEVTKYTAYGALVNHKAVCQGYAVLLYRLLLECGIDCRVISGTSTVNGYSEDHAWNIVKLGGLYYNLDVTWDSKQAGASGNYTYYLCGSNNFPYHTRESAYNTAQFNNAYPMSAQSYNSSASTLPTAFVDVPAGAWYTNAVVWAVKKNITKGITSTEFRPDMDCTRGHIVTFLWRAQGSPAPAANDNPFTDVSSSAFYYKAMLWAVGKGITNGMTETTFGPDLPCTRGQAVTFLWRTKGTPVPNTMSTLFTDLEESAYYFMAVLWASEKGITNGITKTEFRPDMTCSRAHIVTFLYRAFD